MPHGLDTQKEVFFYEQEFYPLSNFSAFDLIWNTNLFPTSEHAYQWQKFPPELSILRESIRTAPSAHEAFRIARVNHMSVRPNWESVKVEVMRRILRAKAGRHEYVRRKLLETGDRQIIENSWRDNFWGWGENKDGTNMLGKLWMEVRDEIKDGIIESSITAAGCREFFEDTK
jgi:hypothetical protein